MRIESSTTPAADSAPKNQMQGTTDEFLKLFMAQLQNQDPLDPKSGSDMVAQLAQLTAVEQTRQTNTQLADLAAAQASTASAGLANLVGRTVDASLGPVEVDKGTMPPIEVSSTGPIKGGSIVITDAAGKEIRRIPIAEGARTATLAWDGKDASGAAVRPGAYQVKIDPGKTGAPITGAWSAKIDAVELTPDGPRLRMGGLLIAPGAVRTIGAYPTPTYPLPGASSTPSGASAPMPSGQLGPGLTA